MPLQERRGAVADAGPRMRGITASYGTRLQAERLADCARITRFPAGAEVLGTNALTLP